MSLEIQPNLFNYADKTRILYAMQNNLCGLHLGKTKILNMIAYLFNKISLINQCTASVKQLSMEVNVSPATTMRAISIMNENNLIEIIHNFENNIKIPNTYILTKKGRNILDNLSDNFLSPVESKLIQRNPYLNYNIYYNYNKPLESAPDDFLNKINIDDIVAGIISKSPGAQEILREVNNNDKESDFDFNDLMPMAECLGLRRNDLYRALVHDGQLTCQCLFLVYFMVKFTDTIKNPCAFFAWLRWKATANQRDDFLMKNFHYVLNRAEHQESVIARKEQVAMAEKLTAEREMNEQEQLQKFMAIKLDNPPPPPPPDDKNCKRLRIVKSLLKSNLSFENGHLLNDLQFYGFNDKKLILWSKNQKSLALLANNTHLQRQFLQEINKEFNQNIDNFQFINFTTQN